MHGKGMCPMRRPTSRVHVHHQNDQDPGKFHIARLHWALSFIAEFYEEREDCEPEGSFFSQISPHLKPDTIRKIHTPTVEFSVIGSGFKASMLV